MRVALVDTEQHMPVTSLYVHIPFCKSRCFYCDFNTYVAPEKTMDQYVRALDNEYEMISDMVTAPLKTVFFGGGTPTLPPRSVIEAMLKSVHRHFRIAPDAEWTMESNPDSIDEDKLRLLKANGVNRISFGAQSFREHLLMSIGRAHDVEAIYSSIEMAHRVGFQHINIDLMFGLPDQTIADVEHALTEVQSLPVDHVSAYWLKVEEGTPFAKWKEKGALPLPGEDAEADMYEMVRETLLRHGFHHYEISNFARDNGEAKHNLVYWRNEPYLAAGAGAHGYVHGERFENVRRIPTYLARLAEGNRPVEEAFSVSVEERAEDQMMVGLRLAEGVSSRRFEDRFGVSIERAFHRVLPSLLEQGLLERCGDIYRIPAVFWPVANAIFEKFVTSIDVD